MALAVVAEDQPTWMRLETRVAELSGLVNAANAALVDAIAEVLETQSWGGVGYRSPEHWVSIHCGVSGSRARELVATARRLAELPACGAAFRAGELSVDQTAVICRSTPPCRDAEVAEIAPHATVSQLRRMVAVLPPEPSDVPAPRPDDEIRQYLGHYTERGTYALRAEMPADEGALWEKAMVAARSDLFGDRVPGLTWVDALLRVATAALDNLDPATAGAEGRIGRPSMRYQAVIHVDGRSGAAQTHLGAWVPPALASYLMCDTTVRLAFHDPDDDGTERMVGISPSAPTADAKLRAVIEHRDRGCRVPGCEQTRWLHIHHIHHREDGGPTIAQNLVAVCPSHHRLHHKGVLGIEGDPERPGGMRFWDRWGHEIAAKAPKPPPGAIPLAHAAGDLGVPDGSTWRHPPGLPLDSRWFTWNDRPRASR